MTNLPLDLENVNPEVKSYIYQTIMEFEPFSTPTTMILVTARDPLKLADEHEDKTRAQLKKMHRIGISLAENGATIEDEAMHENIFEAIRMAKEKLLKTLTEIQDSAISNKDRNLEINSVLQNTTVH